MPNKKNHKNHKNQKNDKNQKDAQKRRPHHGLEGTHDSTANEQSEDMVSSEDINTEAQNEGVYVAADELTKTKGSPAHVHIDKTQAQAEMLSEGGPDFGDEPSEDNAKVHLDFYGSELIRQKAPKAMELADTVAEEWVRDGQFEGLPVGNPIAQIVAAKALRKAKDVEKKLEEKGVFIMAKMGFDYLKAKIDKRNGN